MNNELRRAKAKLSIYYNDINSPIFQFVRDIIDEVLQFRISDEDFLKILQEKKKDYQLKIEELSPVDPKQQKLFNDD